MDLSHDAIYCRDNDRTAPASLTCLDVMTACPKPQVTTRPMLRVLRPEDYEDFQRLRDGVASLENAPTGDVWRGD